MNAYGLRLARSRRLEDARKQLTLLRGEALELERRGFSGQEVNDLKSEAVKLSERISELENDWT
jgi:hypothetical protein